MCYLVLGVVGSAIISMFVCYAEDPDVMARNHPEDYEELADIRPDFKEVLAIFLIRVSLFVFRLFCDGMNVPALSSMPYTYCRSTIMRTRVRRILTITRSFEDIYCNFSIYRAVHVCFRMSAVCARHGGSDAVYWARPPLLITFCTFYVDDFNVLLFGAYGGCSSFHQFHRLLLPSLIDNEVCCFALWIISFGSWNAYHKYLDNRIHVQSS